MTCFRPRTVLLGVRTMSDIFGWGKCAPNLPQKRGVNRRFQAKVTKLKILKLAYYGNYRIDYNQTLHIDKEHQTPFVDGPITHTANPRRRTAAVLEKSKNRHICATVRSISTKFGMAKQFNPLEPSNCQKFEILKIEDGTFWPLKFQKFKNSRWQLLLSWKIEKSPYLSRGLTNLDHICHGDAHRPFWAVRLLKI